MAYVQSKSQQFNNVAQASLAFDNPLAAGSLVVVGATQFQRTLGTGSCADNNGGSYTRVAEAVNADNHCAMWYAYNHGAGATTVTVTPTGSPATEDLSIAIAEDSLIVAGTDPLNASGTGTGTSATHSASTSGATTVPDTRVWVVDGHLGTTSSPAGGNGITVRESQTPNADMPIAMGDKTVSSTGTQTGSFTWENANFAAVIAAFKIDTSGAAAPRAVRTNFPKPVLREPFRTF